MDHPDIPENLINALYHKKEETYLEYKGDVPWSDRAKMLEIIQTIFALSNEKGGGIIVVGVKDDGERSGLSDSNYHSYSHDIINQYLTGRSNQPIQCKLEKFGHMDIDDKKEKKFVFIQVNESKEFPLVYIGHQELINQSVPSYNDNICLRTGALYIRNQSNIGNKEIITVHEWQELIERTYKKFEKETIRRYSKIKEEDVNPFDRELKI